MSRLDCANRGYAVIDLGTRVSQSAYLRAQAARCFRLAQGMASLELFDELEEIGRAYEREAARLENSAEQTLRVGRR
jgi:carbamoylphosphate synthase large subunit